MNADFEWRWIPRMLLVFGSGVVASLACATAARHWFEVPREFVMITGFLWFAPVMFFIAHRLPGTVRAHDGRVRGDLLTVLVTGASLIGTGLPTLWLLGSTGITSQGDFPVPILIAAAVSGLIYAASWGLSYVACKRLSLLVPKTEPRG